MSRGSRRAALNGVRAGVHAGMNRRYNNSRWLDVRRTREGGDAGRCSARGARGWRRGKSGAAVAVVAHPRALRGHNGASVEVERHCCLVGAQQPSDDDEPPRARSSDEEGGRARRCRCTRATKLSTVVAA